MTAKTIKLVLVGLPRVLRDIVEAAVAAQPDLEVVGQLGDSSGLERFVRRSGARAVVAAEEALDEARGLAVVAAVRVRVVTLSADGRRASVYECRPERREIGELGDQTLVELLRQAE